MKYPRTMSEEETLEEIHKGRSVSRFGDGEFRICIGGRAISQASDKELARELRVMLAHPTKSLVCIPNMRAPMESDRLYNWLKYSDDDRFSSLMGHKKFGSSFITRPDSAPNINTEKYWNRIRDIWRDRDVVLVKGSERSLTEELLRGSRSVRHVAGSYHDSFALVDQMMEEIGTPSGPIILCCGAAATVMAERLAKKGLWALDLGHVGMFMRRVERQLVAASVTHSTSFTEGQQSNG